MENNAAKVLKEQVEEQASGMLGIMLLNIGQELNIWQAMKGGDRRTPKELAKSTGLSHRYLEELLRAATLHGYIEYCPGEDQELLRAATLHGYIEYCPGEDQENGQEWDSGIRVLGDGFRLSPGMEEVLLDEKSPNFCGQSFTFPVLMTGQPYEKLIQAFRNDGGVPYSDFGPKCSEFIEKSHQKIYQTQTKDWFKQQELFEEHQLLDGGGVVVDLGCGNGWSSISLAEIYPNTKVHAVDLDPTSIAAAKTNIAIAEKTGKIQPEQVTAHCCYAHKADIAPGSVDLVLLFVCLHDMSNPSEVLMTAKGLLKSTTGCVMVLEFTNPDTFSSLLSDDADKVQVGLSKFCYSASVLHCLPVSKMDQPSQAIGTCFSLPTMKTVAMKGGFTRVSSFKANDTMTMFILRQ